MATDFKVPNLGENTTSGDIVSVLVKEGDVILAQQAVVEIETGKATIELPCDVAGKVIKVHVKQGDTVPVGATLLTVEASGAPAQAAPPVSPAQGTKPAAAAPAAHPPAGNSPAAAKPTAKPVASQPAVTNGPGPAPHQVSGPGPQGDNLPQAVPSAVAEMDMSAAAPAGPATRRFARELGVDLNSVQGTGPNGRITREDVIAAVRAVQTVQTPAVSSAVTSRTEPPGTPARDSFGAVRKERLSKIRRTIADHMSRSHQTIPHVTNFDDADITDLERIRKESSADYASSNIKLTMMAFLIKAIAHSLRLHPKLNASLDLDAGEIIYKQYVNIGVAVDTERGLVVPVMKNADRLSIPMVAESLAALAGSVRAGKFKEEDLRGGTFTISNMGAIGGTYSTPIINWPEVAIILVGRSRTLPVVQENGQIEPRLMMPLSISYDHRLVDGADAARFLNEVKGLLENPGRLLLAP